MKPAAPVFISGEIRALRDKYERMLSLRTAHARARSDPDFVEPNPRLEMAKLADEFPGSLREIDVLPLELIGERIAALELAESHPAKVERWMVAQVMFHGYARGALLTKRWLAGRKTITPALRAAFVEAVASLGAERVRHEATLFVDQLETVADPPRGRLMDLVHARVARDLEVTVAEARTLVFFSGARSRADRR